MSTDCMWNFPEPCLTAWQSKKKGKFVLFDSKEISVADILFFFRKKKENETFNWRKNQNWWKLESWLLSLANKKKGEKVLSLLEVFFLNWKKKTKKIITETMQKVTPCRNPCCLTTIQREKQFGKKRKHAKLPKWKRFPKFVLLLRKKKENKKNYNGAVVVQNKEFLWEHETIDKETKARKDVAFSGDKQKRKSKPLTKDKSNRKEKM